MSGQSAGTTAKAAVEHPVKKGSGAMGSVHMKLVMIMVLLIVCLMTVVGAFLIGISESVIKGSSWSVFSDAFTFALLIVILVVKPTGLFGEKITDKV